MVKTTIRLFNLLKGFTAEFMTPIIEALTFGGVKGSLVISFRVYYAEGPFLNFFNFVR